MPTDPASIPPHVLDALAAAYDLPDDGKSGDHHDRCAIAAALDALFTDEQVKVRRATGRPVAIVLSDVLAAVLKDTP